MTLRWCRLRPASDDRAGSDQTGFTIIEMVVALTLMAGVLLSLAGALFGAMNGLVATRQRSSFVEIANAEMETLRSVRYDWVGVHEDDGMRNTQYAGGTTFESRDAVVIDEDDADEDDVPEAVTTVTSSPLKGITFPYYVRRWVTWTDTFGGTAHQLKRLNVEVQWTENRRSTRKLMLTSLLYPGGGAGVDSSNRAPTAVMIAPVPANGPPGTSFAFSGVGSSDPDAGDTIVTYAWNFGDGYTGSGSTISHVYATAGNYAVTLTVIDSRGKASAPVSRNVGVGSTTNTPPVASFTFGPPNGTAPLTATFASTSTDTGGPIATWDWDWGDGTARGNTEQATHVFQSAGTFTVRLTVTDSGGLTGSTTASITVTPLNCDLISGSFNNDWNNNGPTANNDIKVASKTNEPLENSFEFTATTNAACTTVQARLPYFDKQNGNQTLTVNLAAPACSGCTTRTWTGTGSVAKNNDKFNVGNQTATMTGSDGTTPEVFNYAFNVHT